MPSNKNSVAKQSFNYFLNNGGLKQPDSAFGGTYKD